MPRAPWNLHYDDDSCALRRAFGEGDNQAYLEFRRFGPNPNLQTTLASNGIGTRNPARYRYRFGSEAEWREGTGINVTLADGFKGMMFHPTVLELPQFEGLEEEEEEEPERQLYFNSLAWRELEIAAAARMDTVTVRGAFRSDLTLQLGRLDAPLAALNECIDELMTHWDIDVEAHKTLTRPTTPIDVRRSVRMIDYPPKMLRQSLPGLVNIRLAIDETGRVTACHIQMPLGDPEFAESSCADIQHAFEFEPALDKEGQPIRSYFSTTIRFQIAG